jgi:hypothetical protein
MGALGFLFGVTVLVAGTLVAVGFFGEKANPLLVGLGFVLFALCAIFGVQPGFMNPDRDKS